MAAVRPVKWTSELLNTFWDGIAQTRLTELSFSELAGHECLYVFSSFLDKSVPYLDFGSGDGALADLLCQAGYRVAVYDPSGDRTRLAVDRLSKHETFLGVVNKETETRFGGVFLVEVAEHVLEEDLVETYSTISQLLADGGLLFLTTPNKEDLDLGACYEPINSVLFHRWQHVRSFDRSSLAKMLMDFDLNEVVIHEIDFRPEFIKAVKDLISDESFPDPFACRRPVVMGAGPNLVGIFSKGRSDIKIDPRPYTINMKVVAEAPSESPDHESHEGRLDLVPDQMEPDTGHCYRYQLSQTCGTDNNDGSSVSRLRVYENGTRLGSAHAMHDAIRNLGLGRFSHWEGDVLYFSSSDNSDPRSNGKTYSVTFPLTETVP